MFKIQMVNLNNVSVKPMNWHVNGLTLLYLFYIVKA